MDKTTRERIRSLYSKNVRRILKDYPRIDAYIYNWEFTPIEINVWHEICKYRLPFCPQFPVGPYFIDFADPIKKIAIEVDGHEWHQDKEKDHHREDYLRSLGWRICRIPGRNTFFTQEEINTSLEEWNACGPEDEPIVLPFIVDWKGAYRKTAESYFESLYHYEYGEFKDLLLNTSALWQTLKLNDAVERISETLNEDFSK